MSAAEAVADVIVVGFGGAGAVAAIEAHDAGASVMVIERADEGGGSTRESGGSLRIITDLEQAVTHFRTLTFGSTPEPVLRAFAEGCLRIPAWVEAHGGALERAALFPHEGFPHHAPSTSFPDLPGAAGIDGRLRVEGSGGLAGGTTLWELLERNVRRRGVDVRHGVRGRRLLRDGGGRIAGVAAETAGGSVELRARRGVVLASGGFNYDAEMQRQYLGLEVAALSPPGRNTGDGVRMAQEVGADLWHMHAAVASFGYRVPGYDAAFFGRVRDNGYFIVDQLARRYVNESAVENHSGLLTTMVIDPIEGRYLRIPSYLVFDDRTRSAGPIVETAISYNRKFPWSNDNAAEIDKGWISRASSVAELARLLGLPQNTLEDTARRFDEAAAKGGDELGRPATAMRSLEGPPFFGIALWPVLLNTQGGPRRDEQARVLDPFGRPISGLFSAGELGSMWSTLYPGAGNVAECLVFGWIAGRNAAAANSA